MGRKGRGEGEGGGVLVLYEARTAVREIVLVLHMYEKRAFRELVLVRTCGDGGVSIPQSSELGVASQYARSC